MATSLVALKILFSGLTCVMAATVTYVFLIEGSSCFFDPHARWMQVSLTDFAIDASLIGAWFFYKESGWIIRLLYIITVVFSGSTVICGYIVMLLFKLTPEESSKDPIYFVLARRQKWDEMGYKRTPSIVAAKVIVAALGCLMIGALVYAFVVDGSPFHMEVLTLCLITMLIDIKIYHVALFTVWIAYKESSWKTAFFWGLLVSCFGSIGVCSYIMQELFCLSPEQPIYLILFSKSNRGGTRKFYKRGQE